MPEEKKMSSAFRFKEGEARAWLKNLVFNS